MPCAGVAPAWAFADHVGVTPAPALADDAAVTGPGAQADTANAAATAMMTRVRCSRLIGSLRSVAPSLTPRPRS